MSIRVYTAAGKGSADGAAAAILAGQGRRSVRLLRICVPVALALAWSLSPLVDGANECAVLSDPRTVLAVALPLSVQAVALLSLHRHSFAMIVCCLTASASGSSRRSPRTCLRVRPPPPPNPSGEQMLLRCPSVQGLWHLHPRWSWFRFRRGRCEALRALLPALSVRLAFEHPTPNRIARAVASSPAP